MLCCAKPVILCDSWVHSLATEGAEPIKSCCIWIWRARSLLEGAVERRSWIPDAKKITKTCQQRGQMFRSVRISCADSLVRHEEHSCVNHSFSETGRKGGCAARAHSAQDQSYPCFLHALWDPQPSQSFQKPVAESTVINWKRDCSGGQGTCPLCSAQRWPQRGVFSNRLKSILSRTSCKSPLGH